MKKLIVILSFLLISCTGMTNKNISTVIAPESLVSSQFEQINFNLSSDSSIDELTSWINTDQPMRAELACVGKLCSKAREILSSFDVSYKHVSTKGKDNMVILFYNRSKAYDCSKLSRNIQGCTTSVNIVDMISDRQQLVEPVVSGMIDAESAIKAINQ